MLESLFMVVHSYVIKARQRQGGRWSLSREIILGIWTHKKEFAKVQFSNYTPPNTQNKIDHQQVCEK